MTEFVGSTIRIGILASLTCLPFLANPAHAYTYRAGERGIVVLPVNNSNSKTPLTNAHITVRNSPSWLKIIPASNLGPTTIGPGTDHKFEIEYVVILTTDVDSMSFDYQLSMDKSPGIKSEFNCSDMIIHDGTGALQNGTKCVGPSGDTLLYHPIPDTTAPQSTATFSMAPYRDATGNMHISSETLIYLSAADPTTVFSNNSMVFYNTSGVDHIFVATGRSMNSLGDYRIYKGAFSLPEGLAAISFYGKDKAGNAEARHTLLFYVHDTPPTTQAVVIGSGTIDHAGNISLDPSSSLQLRAVEAGAKKYRVGISRSLAIIDGGSMFVATGTITLPVGAHQFAYVSIDNVGNPEPWHFVHVSVGVPVTSTPPARQFHIDSDAISGWSGRVSGLLLLMGTSKSDDKLIRLLDEKIQLFIMSSPDDEFQALCGMLRIPCGEEILPDEQYLDTDDYAFRQEGLSVRVLLDKMIKRRPGFIWEISDGTLVLRPRDVGFSSPLDNYVHQFILNGKPLYDVIWELEGKEWIGRPEGRIYVGPPPSEEAEASESRGIDISCKDKTVRGILNSVVNTHGHGMWIYTYARPSPYIPRLFRRGMLESIAY